EKEEEEKEKIGNNMRSSNSICSVSVGFTGTFSLTFSFPTSILVSVK
ncbi:14426_t:CDS:1, partial [Cetraspora pellucida]